MAVSRASATKILTSCILISQRMRAALAGSCQLILHRSQWRCLANSYSAVLQVLFLLLEHACSLLGAPSQQESMCHKLIRPLRALREAVQEGETCMQETQLPSSSTFRHSWLVESALKRGMSTEIVDTHLHRLLWTSSVVCEQMSRYAPIDDINGSVSAKQITRDLCEIWAHVDSPDDLLVAQSMLSRIIAEEEGETSLLANFILQKLVSAEHKSRITDSADLPSFLWVVPQDLRRNANTKRGGNLNTKIEEAVWLGGKFAVKDIFHVENSVQLDREVTIQAQLHHPNVMPLVCCSREPLVQKLSLVMELMHQDLRNLILHNMESAKMETPFSLLHAIDLMLQIAQGMEYLHGADLRIIHRDLKSYNILVGFSSSAGASSSHARKAIFPPVQLKVSDFGVSKAKFTSSRYTTCLVGTTPWMAPEVYEEEGNERYKNKADVYSFGMVCYEILTGKLPFEGMHQIRKKVRSGERPRLPLNCPRALSSYIERCWHADPEERPSFTQICRMLRFFKACILLRDFDDDDNALKYSEWLLHPLSTGLCALIDKRLSNLVVKEVGGVIQPPLVAIPLEMYYCRVVLTESRDETRIAHNFSRSPRDAGIHQVAEIQRTAPERKGLRRRPAKNGHFNKTSEWLKKLFWTRPPHPPHNIKHANSGAHDTYWQVKIQYVLRNMATEFTEQELCKATNGFSDRIGQRSGIYLGELADGQRIAVKKHFHCHSSEKKGVLAAIQLQHPNIVPLLGWCQEVNSINLVYKYMPNGDMREHIFPKDGNSVFGWQQRYRVVCEVAKALNYAHNMGIVHRNIKPSNILFSSEWNACLGGWRGSTLLLEDDGSIEGTFGYLAPDYVRTKKSSTALDIYSFGVTVLEIATGQRPLAFANNGNRRGRMSMMVEWVWELYEEEELMQAADVRLAGKFEEAEMRRMLLLGLSCLKREPEERPSMEEVLRVLSNTSDPCPPQDTSQIVLWRPNGES